MKALKTKKLDLLFLSGAFITSNLIMYFLVHIPLEAIVGLWTLLLGSLFFIYIFGRLFDYEPHVDQGRADQNDQLAIELSMRQHAPRSVQGQIKGPGLYIHNPGPDSLKKQFIVPIHPNEVMDENDMDDFCDKWGLHPVSSEDSNYVFEFESPNGRPTEQMKQYEIVQTEKAKAFKEKHEKRQSAQ